VSFKTAGSIPSKLKPFPCCARDMSFKKNSSSGVCLVFEKTSQRILSHHISAIRAIRDLQAIVIMGYYERISH
jgi:hypothetical protein